jgi:hypothetical protein
MMVMVIIVTPAQGWMERSVAELAQMMRQGKVAASTLVEEGLQKQDRGEGRPQRLHND